MKNTKVLGLAILASFITLPALAGETYVRNEWTDTNTVTKTDLHLDSTTKSLRLEKYDSYANKEYYEGTKEVSYEYGKKGPIVTTDYGDGYSAHYAGSNLWGVYAEANKTTLYGSIKSLSFSKSKAHETSAGVR